MAGRAEAPARAPPRDDHDPPIVPVGGVSLPGGSVRGVMGMGGVDGPAAARRRRVIAGVLVLALVLGVGAVVLSLF